MFRIKRIIELIKKRAKKKEERMNPREIFSNNLNRLMKEKGITQSDICKKFNITASTVSDWAKGTNYPRVDRMQQLADYFGVLMTDLIKENNHSSPSIISTDNLRPKQRILFDRSKELTDAQADMILGIVNEILKEKDNDGI